jgi:1-deoxy-D-xylulose-5-phosphate reductoisomerase
MKSIAILGASGSIGTQALDIVRNLNESFCVEALAYHSNIDLAQKHIEEFKPSLVAVYDESKALELKARGVSCRVVGGESGVLEAASLSNVEFVLVAIVGIAGLKPTLAAIEAKKTIGLANKETLVAAGEVVMAAAKANGVSILPIDSEHSAIFQCMQGESLSSVHRVVVTASGGPFRDLSLSQLGEVSVEEALKHPNWDMGAKVTVDSSTLMNKGLEMIEAKWLFDLEPKQVEAVIHPQSLVHSFVEFCDGSLIAQVSEPDMHLPIQYAMTYPKRVPRALPSLDFSKMREMTFYPPDELKFGCLKLAKEAMFCGGSLPCFMNAANEALVNQFLNKKISWVEIGNHLEKLMDKHQNLNNPNLELLLEVDQEARAQVAFIA